MEQLAEPGSIFIAPPTAALAEGFVQVVAQAPMVVKGLAAPVDVYKLVGAHSVRSRLEATAARGLSRFVGRKLEVAHLDRVMVQAWNGRGQVLAVVGEPGVGKSRLVFELAHSREIEAG